MPCAPLPGHSAAMTATHPSVGAVTGARAAWHGARWALLGPAGGPPRRRRAGRTLLLDVAAPLAVYYALRAAGVADVVALALGAVPPAVSAVLTAVRERRVEPLALLVLVTMALGLAATAITGDPRELLVRHAWLSLPFGLWLLATLRSARPFCFEATRTLLPHRAAVMEELWTRDEAFRRAWFRITAVWGAAMLADTVLRMVMAALLPVPVVPALDTALTVLTVLALQVPTHLFLRRSGTWDLLFRPSTHRGAHHDDDH
jgi:hypothetical protein